MTKWNRSTKYGWFSLKAIIFFGIQVFILLLACWPGLFWGNIAKTLFGIPYFLVYVFLLTCISDIVLVIQYFMDRSAGEVDFEIDPEHDYLEDAAILEQMEKEIPEQTGGK